MDERRVQFAVVFDDYGDRSPSARRRVGGQTDQWAGLSLLYPEWAFKYDVPISMPWRFSNCSSSCSLLPYAGQFQHGPRHCWFCFVEPTSHAGEKRLRPAVIAISEMFLVAPGVSLVPGYGAIFRTVRNELFLLLALATYKFLLVLQPL